jgi:hypothetical protein
MYQHASMHLQMATNHPDRGMHFDDFLYVFKG